LVVLFAPAAMAAQVPLIVMVESAVSAVQQPVVLVEPVETAVQVLSIVKVELAMSAVQQPVVSAA
jgi:hypothetical protein